MLFWITIVVAGVWFTWVLRQMPLTWRTRKLITVWSATAGAGAAVVVAVAFAFAGAPIGLSVLTGLPVGGLVLAFSITQTYRRLDFLRSTVTQRWAGLWFLFWVVVAGPGFMVRSVVELDNVSETALQLMVMATGFAGYAFGGILATLDHLEGGAQDPRLHVLTPPPGERRGGGASG